jgi:hypothetical protein
MTSYLIPYRYLRAFSPSRWRGDRLAFVILEQESGGGHDSAASVAGDSAYQRVNDGAQKQVAHTARADIRENEIGGRHHTAAAEKSAGDRGETAAGLVALARGMAAPSAWEAE